jgi:phosphocarrier protein
MTEEKVTVKNRAGLHARPASVLVKTAQKFDSSIFLEKDEMKVNAKSIMNIFALAATYNSEIIVSAEGCDEKEAVSTICTLFNNRFEDPAQEETS